MDDASVLGGSGLPGTTNVVLCCAPPNVATIGPETGVAETGEPTCATSTAGDTCTLPTTGAGSGPDGGSLVWATPCAATAVTVPAGANLATTPLAGATWTAAGVGLPSGP